MTEPRWWSEPVSPRGAITSEGILRQLGTPTVDPLTVFVRETAQNSWDARIGEVVEYSLDVHRVPDQFVGQWRDLLSPGPDLPHLDVAAAFETGTLRILAVSDRGTRGMGGPTRADGDPPPVHDWIAFVLNIGEPRDTPGGGGTYGYGKAVYYQLSRVRTILVYTRAADAGRLSTRMIGIALAPSYTANGRSYTGRYWWGHPAGDYVEPLVDEDAELVAEKLGLPGFAPDETGTTVVVLDPDFGDVADDITAARHLAEDIAWHLWPIQLPERAPRLVATVTCGQRDIPVPDPVTAYPLNLFVRAYRALPTDAAETIVCGNPRRDLGRLSLIRDFVVPGAATTTGGSIRADVSGDPHHVCLLREPELVVRYMPGPEPFLAEFAYAGVFRAETSLDEVFAKAEPPTHDDWVDQHLTGTARTFVRVTKRRIADRLREFTRPATARATASDLPLGGISNFLGSLIAVAGGEGASVPLASRPTGGSAGGGASGGGAGTGGGGRRERAARPDGEPEWVERDGELILLQRVFVTPGARLRCDFAVRTTDGTRETEPPIGAPWPQALGWEFGDGSYVAGVEADVPPAVTAAAVLVRPADDAVIDIDVRERDPQAAR